MSSAPRTPAVINKSRVLSVASWRLMVLIFAAFSGSALCSEIQSAIADVNTSSPLGLNIPAHCAVGVPAADETEIVSSLA
eukprot:CAMPEP_0115356080 /NCGR_PEP_ID=MMETSP0270-20121206/99429_1 /TAXON_ID=71861 /ORGANISM="Scrippsiella trochoidea, Strain CCMP3099" /LENGTH=79 /DNA_ID=CAMNT_0002778457 /DNA_START=82 /DNA_END=321 /DNA_ORIENTATION=+